MLMGHASKDGWHHFVLSDWSPEDGEAVFPRSGTATLSLSVFADGTPGFHPADTFLSGNWCINRTTLLLRALIDNGLPLLRARFSTVEPGARSLTVL